MCPSSGELNVSVRHLVYAALCRLPSGVQVYIPTCVLDGHVHRVVYIRCRIDTINSPDDGYMLARNMWRIEINIRKNCASSWFIYKDSILILQDILHAFQPDSMLCSGHFAFRLYHTLAVYM